MDDISTTELIIAIIGGGGVTLVLAKTIKVLADKLMPGKHGGFMVSEKDREQDTHHRENLERFAAISERIAKVEVQCVHMSSTLDRVDSSLKDMSANQLAISNEVRNDIGTIKQHFLKLALKGADSA